MPVIPAIASLLVCGLGVVLAPSARGQQFEVASVKPAGAGQANGSSGMSSGVTTGHGRLTANNVTLKRCIMGAWGVGPNQISGGPAWLDSDRFEIAAKAGQPVDDEVILNSMLRNLLAERFKLAVHRENRTVEALVLEVAKNGPKLEKTDAGEAATNSSRGRIDARKATMDHFADVLSRQMDLPVINRTGLEGAFNLKLEWTPESLKPAGTGTAGAATEQPSIFTAIQQQLGLRLRSEKTPVEILVVDHAERPSEN
jgi:uncharacterized protein (TIGR03435 family)